YARCRRGDARGLVVSPGGLLQDQLVQRQIRHRTAKPIVLRLEILQPLDLVALQAAELLPPAVVSHLAHPDRADRFRYALTLRGQNINLPQLGDDLFRLVAPPWHSGPPCEQNHSSGWTTSAGVDQSPQRRSALTRGAKTARRPLRPGAFVLPALRPRAGRDRLINSPLRPEAPG